VHKILCNRVAIAYSIINKFQASYSEIIKNEDVI